MWLSPGGIQLESARWVEYYLSL